MKKNLSDILHESIELELNISRLYTLFHDLYPEDEELWWQLAIEERNHAALLRYEKSNQQNGCSLAEGFLAPDLEGIREANSLVITLIERFGDNCPPREEAFSTALEIENSIGEAHYQAFLDSDEGHSVADELFRQLNQGDKDHARRIEAYVASHTHTMEELM
ncbi:hypothetical protein [Prosthecochloris sp. CIB 2401]|uniref:hypothetical protein n=1 Tax=Prosthecochloris sp. CIB 2401 TaxID=1868325 RepID=UPI00080ABCAB|nr:hypothetical protein [Prosthecochloris sp. CIB 2401]ANT64389.1 hypothetical protein Ptc2401_00590 [Prosthecochloris sp. CIB 2401]